MSGGDFDAFEWDPKKSDETFRMRGFDFATAALVFGGIYLEYEVSAKTTASSATSSQVLRETTLWYLSLSGRPGVAIAASYPPA